MKNPVITGLGELLWDVFPEYKRPGGAPANVSFHATKLGNKGIPASRIGDDDDGHELLSILKKHGLDTSSIQIDQRVPTGTVEIVMKNGEASYTIPEGVAWDHLSFSSEWMDLARESQAVCFGTLAQRDSVSRKTIREFLNHTSKDCLKVADINLRPPHFTPETLDQTIELADVLKLNESEWKNIADTFGVSDLKDWLFNTKGVDVICLTKGVEGAEIMTPDQHLIEPIYPVDNTYGDSVGVGDAFTAALTHHLLRKSPLDVAITAANTYAGHVSARKGAMPELPSAVIQSVV
ncbi:carbohydrate kinase [Balneolaceae bacterium ANBcel3]|nr:carbohydrate kinase [Balneolaceae bacterium ANBcel3]